VGMERRGARLHILSRGPRPRVPSYATACTQYSKRQVIPNNRPIIKVKAASVNHSHCSHIWLIVGSTAFPHAEEH